MLVDVLVNGHLLLLSLRLHEFIGFGIMAIVECLGDLHRPVSIEHLGSSDLHHLAVLVVLLGNLYFLLVAEFFNFRLGRVKFSHFCLLGITFLRSRWFLLAHFAFHCPVEVLHEGAHPDHFLAPQSILGVNELVGLVELDELGLILDS